MTESQANPNSAKALNFRDASMKHSETNFLKNPVLDARWKTKVPGENLQKHAWTGNQMHISAGTENWTRNSLVQSEERNATLPCFQKKKILGFSVNANVIVDLEQWSIASITWVRRSQKGVKTLCKFQNTIPKALWCNETNYNRNKLTKCIHNDYMTCYHKMSVKLPVRMYRDTPIKNMSQNNTKESKINLKYSFLLNI